MQLHVGTESTWSLRAWMCAQIAGITVDINVFDLTRANDVKSLKEMSPTGLVPFLSDEHLTIYDSLAIAEYFNELSLGALYPLAAEERAYARSLCQELHAGFQTLRARCPFSATGEKQVIAIDGALEKELARIEAIFAQANLPFMFNREGVVDAFYAILAFRLHCYGINFSGKAGDYQHALLHWSLLKQAIDVATRWKQ